MKIGYVGSIEFKLAELYTVVVSNQFHEDKMMRDVEYLVPEKVIEIEGSTLN